MNLKVFMSVAVLVCGFDILEKVNTRKKKNKNTKKSDDINES